MTRPDKNAGRIVVGADGSSSSMTALRWAIRQARLTGCVVEAVTAWRLPSSYGLGTARGGGDGLRGRRA